MSKSQRWSPSSDRRTPAQRRLAAAVRAGLVFSSSDGEIAPDGIRQWPPNAEAGAEVRLRSLEWHKQEACMHMSRSMTRWRFKGVAEVAAHPVDFYGDCLCDVATGAFYEFELRAAGLPPA